LSSCMTGSAEALRGGDKHDPNGGLPKFNVPSWFLGDFRQKPLRQ